MFYMQKKFMYVLHSNEKINQMSTCDIKFEFKG